jgi:membrane-bound lytic murein transglycosylase B
LRVNEVLPLQSIVRIGLAALVLAFLPSSLGLNAASADPAVRMSAPVYDDPADRSPEFQKWIASFRSDALSQGITAATFDQAFANVKLSARVIELNENQPEFSRAIWDYMDSAVSSDRIEKGRAHMRKFRKSLGRAEDKHGVPPSIITAIWSLESNFGKNLGGFNVIEALATLAFEGRRATFGREQLIAALKIIQSGDIEARRMVGSWAGAMGQTQFIPTVFLQYAEDGNGDGKRDLWDTKSDVFNSTANYLSNKGWQQDAPCFDEVKLPDGFDHALADISIEKPVKEWASLGVTRMHGQSLQGRQGVNRDAPAAILLPGGHKGPAFIAYPNFKAVLAYNNAISYALAICQLSRRIDGGVSFETPWPRSEPLILSRNDRLELQTLLDKNGYDVGEPDGVLGKKSREAIRAFQKKQNVPQDGFATMSLLLMLRQLN